MAKIKLNNNEYLISDSTLATPTAAFIAHLGTVAGNGIKVVVNSVEYSVDSSKMSTAVSEMETVFGNLSGGSGGGGWKGTPVIGTWDGESDVEALQPAGNIYFNTDLSIEEVVDTLSKLDYGDLYGTPTVLICMMDSSPIYVWYVAIAKSDDEYMILDPISPMVFFASSSNVWQKILGWDAADFVGWNPDFGGSIPAGVLTAPGTILESYRPGMSFPATDFVFDTQQEQYAHIISLTPFEKV